MSRDGPACTPVGRAAPRAVATIALAAALATGACGGRAADAGPPAAPPPVNVRGFNPSTRRHTAVLGITLDTDLLD